MRKTVCLIGALLVMLLLALPVHAEEAQLTIPELGIAFTMPDGVTYFTRDTPADDPLFGSPEVGEEYLAYMKESDIYLCALAPDGSWEITVNFIPMSIFDNREPDDSTMKMLERLMSLSMEQSGAEITSTEMYRAPSLPFVHIAWYLPDLDRYSEQYLTALSGNIVGVSIYGYGVPVPTEQSDLLLTMVDSFQLTEAAAIPNLTETWARMSSFTYTHPETGVTITVPGGWVEVPLTQERTYIDTKFEWANDPSCCISFGVSDIWAEMSPLQRLFIPRSKLDSGNLSIEEIADIYEVDVSAVTQLKLGGHYWIRLVYFQSAESLDLELQTTALLLYEDGWQYMLHYLGEPSDPQYMDMEEIAKSIQIPTPQKDPVDRNVLVLAQAVLMCTAVFVVLALLLKRRKVKRGTRCSRCGYTCRYGSAYCVNCGFRLK